MGVGLVKSYSRGAWVGAAVGMALIAKAECRRKNAERGKAESRKQKAETNEGNAEMLKAEMLKAVRRWGALAIICASLGVMGFWTLRHSEGVMARRVCSVGNANDFSWNRRLAAYEGALRMLADKPWIGFGWNQPEPLYSALYCPASVDEGMAIRLNDYLMLGMTLGLPALLCFAVYGVLALSGRQRSALPAEPTLDFRLWTLDSPAVCQAGAVVLLVGFWFDGGLFRLATGATFWILLELGRQSPRGGREALTGRKGE